MKTTRSKILILTGVIMFVLSILIFNMAHVSAADTEVYDTKDGKWMYQIVNASKKTVSLVAYCSDDKKDFPQTLNIPSSVVSEKGVKYTVTELGYGYVDYDEVYNDNLFEYCDGDYSEKVKKIVIPSSVQKINQGMFGYGLQATVAFAQNSKCTTIGEYVFSESDITEITIPKLVKKIDNYAFENCEKLKKVSFEKGSQLTSIGCYAFSKCNALTSLKLPSGVTTLGEGFISECDSLTTFEIPAGIKDLDMAAFINSTAIVKFAANSTCIKIYNSLGYFDDSANLGDFVIPASVKEIGNSSFYGAKVTSVKFASGSNCTGIGGSAFSSCSGLTAVTLPAKLTSIGDWAFEDCTKLKSITIPAGVTKIGEYAFAGCSSLTTITMSANSKLTEIPDYFAQNCGKLTAFTVTASIKKIGTEAFSRCRSLASVTFSANSKCSDIGDYAFAGCSALKSIKLPASVTKLESGVFMSCIKLTEIDIEADSIDLPYCDTFATNAYNSDEGAWWGLWSDLGTFSGNIYVNNDDVKYSVSDELWDYQLTDEPVVPQSCIIIRNYTVILEEIDKSHRGKIIASKTVGYNEKFKISDFAPAAPDGYKYEWTLPNRGGLVDPNAAFSRLSKNGYLYILGWLSECTYTVKYDANGGAGKMGAQEEIKYSSDLTLRTNAFSRRGYVFGGWNTSADGTGKAYADGASVSKITNNDEIVLYAQWKKIESFVYYLPYSIKNGKFVCNDYSHTVYSGNVESVMDYDQAVAAASSVGGKTVTDELTYIYMDGENKEQTITKKWSDIAAFEGWNTTDQTDGRVSFRYPGTATESTYRSGQNITIGASVALVPNIVYKKLTISFDGGQAEEDMVDVVSEHGQLASESLQNKLNRDGYEFAGWTVAQMTSGVNESVLIPAVDLNRGGQLDESDVYALYMFADSNLHVTLKPVWSRLETYMIQFKANGGSGSMKQITYICGEKRKLPECTFYRKGYIFAGWSVDGIGPVSYGDGSVISRTAEEGDVQLFAVWNKLNYTLVYDANGGDGYMPNQTVESQSRHTLKTVGYVKEGAEFLEWNTRADGSGTAYPDGGTMIHAALAEGETMTLYAIWNPNIVMLSFNANGGLVSRASKQVQYGEPCGTLPTPKRTGYTFSGWFTRRNGGSQYTADTIVDVDSDIVLYARWESQKYKVSFNANGGKLSGVSTIEVTSGKSIGQLPGAARKGYAFDGWYTSSEGGIKVNTVYKVTGNVTLFAHWKLTTKKIRIVMNVAKIAGAKGYELQYSTSAGFGGAVTLTDRMTNAGSYSREVGNLKAGTTYYFRVRSYAVKRGKKVYGSWSAVQRKTTSK